MSVKVDKRKNITKWAQILFSIQLIKKIEIYIYINSHSLKAMTILLDYIDMELYYKSGQINICYSLFNKH